MYYFLFNIIKLRQYLINIEIKSRGGVISECFYQESWGEGNDIPAFPGMTLSS